MPASSSRRRSRTTRTTVFSFLSHLVQVDDHDTLANGPLAVAGAMEAIDKNTCPSRPRSTF